jgi:hypothetical protein
MKKFWSVFWKVFGISLVLAIVTGIIMGLVSRSGDVIYTVVMGTVAAGFGICGIIGLAVIPVEMFFEDRMKGRGTENAAE